MTSLVALALACGLGSGSALARPSNAPDYVLTGVAHIPEAELRQAASRQAPARDDSEKWAKRAVTQILKVYSKQGYTEARAWTRVEENGQISIHVDEGIMARIVFIGAGAYRGTLYRVDLNLPADLFNGPILEKALKELKNKHHLGGVSYKVVETDYLVAMPLGHLAPVRELRIYVVSLETFGWGFDLNFDSMWGPILKARFGVGSLFLDNDRLRTALFIAIPYRSFIFSADPRFSWVHSELDLAYRFPPFASGHLAPQIDSQTGLSHFSRSFPDISDSYVFKTSALAGVALLYPPLLEGHLSVGPEYYRFFGDDGESPFLRSIPDPSSPQNRGLLRFTLSVGAALHFSPEVLREDMRDGLWFELRNSLTESGQWMGAVNLSHRAVWSFGPSVLILRSRGILRTGDVRFFDEVSVAGTYTRAFFENRYWVREATQVEAEFRLAVWKDSVHVGLFNDFAIFGDRSMGTIELGWAETFGPSLHFMWFDRFAVDLYYGLGFAPVGFSQNFSFETGTVF